jgi:hypothetical protein
MNLTFNQSYGKIEKVTTYKNSALIQFHPIKKPEPNDSGFPCRQEHRIIEPNMAGVANNHLTK